jgi:sugar phosphate isomerase/epimerase
MKVGVFTVLLADRPLEEALDYVREAGCEAVEIGTGGYPGNAHCKPKELLGDQGALDRFRQTVENRGL